MQVFAPPIAPDYLDYHTAHQALLLGQTFLKLHALYEGGGEFCCPATMLAISNSIEAASRHNVPAITPRPFLFDVVSTQLIAA